MIEIKKYFQKTVPISEKDWEFFSSKLLRREFAKNSIILKVGHKENYLSFIEKGIVRKCIPQEFDDLTFEFAFVINAVRLYRPVFNNKMDKACYLFSFQASNGPFREFVFVKKKGNHWVFVDSYGSHHIDSNENWFK